MSEPIPQPRWHPAAALHFLWAVPVACALTLVAGFAITLTWCGISGCSGGGFGRISDPSPTAALVGGVAVVGVWFITVSAVPWHSSRRLRQVVALVVAVVVAALTVLVSTAGFVR